MSTDCITKTKINTNELNEAILHLEELLNSENSDQVIQLIRDFKSKN